MSKRIISVFLSLILVFIFINTVFCPVFAQVSVRVACVGDSITEGDGTNNYVTRMIEKLDSGYTILNFGKSGTTFSETGDYPYKSCQQYKDSLLSKPDIVIIMLGTNDGKPYNWTESHQSTIKANMINLINEYISLETHPKVYLAFSPSAQCVQFDIVPENVDRIVEIEKEVAEELDIDSIDIHALTDGRGDCFYDGIHPGIVGQNLIADAFIDRIKNDGTIPGAPVNLSTKDMSSHCLVSWSDGPKNNLPVQSYNVFVDDVFYKTVNSANILISKLENGKEYKVSVSSVNSKGESDKSSIYIHPTAAVPEVSGVEDGAQYDLSKGEFPVPSWTTKTATATLNGESLEKQTKIDKVGEYELIITNDNVVLTYHFSVIDSSVPEIIGDYDGDGEVTVADALAVLRIAAKLVVPTSDDIKVADMDKDGVVTVADALAVLRIAAKLV